MLPRLRASAKKTIGLLERRVSSSKQNLKQTNETSGFVRNQHKAELPPDAKATPAATPKPPSPSTTGASSSASSSSSVFSSWKFRPSFSKYALTLGPLGVLGAGALLYSLSGNADGGSDDRRKSSKWKAESPFFNRSNEQKVFNKNLKGMPGVITVLVGPPSCGKSRFLKEMVDQLGLGQDPPPVIFINSRLVRVNGPEAISKALVDEVTSQDNLLNLSKFPDLVQGILEQVSMVAGVKTQVGNVSFNLGELAKFFKMDEENLTETIKKLEILFKSIASLPRKPVIVIDEANNLMDWTEPGPSQPKLKTMLDFLVAISKEANLVHVVLATSDYFLANWIKGKGVATNNFRIHVLGDLTEEEAREFVYGTAVGATIDPLSVAAPGVAAPVVTWPGIINDPSEPIAVPGGAEEQWQAIYERCGGNIGMLKQCVGAARELGSWKDALDIVVANSRSAIEQGFKPKVIPKRDELPDWFEDQWAMVLQRLTTAPHHAVLRNELAKNLGKGDEERGDEIILSMVKYNLLALRSYSTLARDLPREVYGVEEEEVVTLPSAGHTWAAKRILLKRKRDAYKSAAELAEKAKSKPKKYFNLF
ncbi:putative ATP-binding protein [Nannochloris sp. 'desiccata']|nr:putative ATP-binding protein [Chlorella desiccata (nom. nud.)]